MDYAAQKVYNVSYVCSQGAGVIPLEASNRREAVKVVTGRMGPSAVAVVTGVRS